MSPVPAAALLTLSRLVRWATSALTATVLVAGLLGCAHAPAPPQPQPLLRDASFAAPAEPVLPEQALAASPAMQRYLREDIASQLRQLGPQRGLVEALYKRSQLKVEYDATRTRNAAQAFEARSGNCLSLVLMTAALARELGLQVHFQSAYVDDVWSRRGELMLRSGHVNITLGPASLASTRGVDITRFTIDFLPPEELRGLRTREIGETTVVAMFLNNRAAEHLAAGAVNEAYWWARAALLHEPAFLPATNTLGVIYQRQGDLAAAEQAFATVLSREGDNTRALFNLGQVLAQAGRHDEARAAQARLAAIEPHPPYHFFDLGRAALERGDAVAARELFSKELARAPYHAEFHFWLAVAQFRLGDAKGAREQLELAREHSTRSGERALYAAKLEWLRGRK